MITPRGTSPRLLALLVLLVCHLPCPAEAVWQIDPGQAQTVRAETVSGLQALFQTLDYSWKQLEKGVPPFILESLPADIDNAATTASKKRAFFMGLLPMILLANQEIAVERDEVEQILARSRARQPELGDRQRLAEIASRYGLLGRPLVDHRTRTHLLRRVDIIPPALVLAQAANESAWGTSRFAQLGNNLFGEWTFNPGTGIVPADRPAGEIYEVRKFSSIYESIRSYMNNLNSHVAYRRLRDIRAKLRNQGQPVTGIALTKGLHKYSERGEDYIREIQAMIRQNSLSRANAAFLRRQDTEMLTGIGTSGGGLLSSRNRMIGHLSSVGTDP